MSEPMTRDQAVAIISHSWAQTGPKLVQAAQALLRHMQIQDTRIFLLESALEDTGKELVRARIDACKVTEFPAAPHERKAPTLLSAVDRQGEVTPFPTPEPLAKPEIFAPTGAPETAEGWVKL